MNKNTFFPVSSHQVLWAALLQLIQLFVYVRQILIDGVQLCLHVFVLLVFTVKFTLVVAARLLICYGRKFTEVENNGEEREDGGHV